MIQHIYSFVTQFSYVLGLSYLVICQKFQFNHQKVFWISRTFHSISEDT